MLHTQIHGEGPPIILLHGFGFNSGVWDLCAQPLSTCHQVIRVDLPGFGQSVDLPPSYDLSSLGEVVKNTVGEVTTEPACWLGWSLGGLVALSVVARWPALASSLVMVASNPCFIENPSVPWPGMKKTALKQFSQALLQDPLKTLEQFIALQTLGAPLPPPHSLRSLKNLVLQNKKPDTMALSGGCEILLNTDLRKALARVSCPVLHMVGRLDRLVPATLAEALTQWVPHHRIKTFTQSAHMPFITEQSLFLKTLSHFLDQTILEPTLP